MDFSFNRPSFQSDTAGISHKFIVPLWQNFDIMKAFTIEIYNDEMVRQMERLKAEKGITFAQQCRTGLRMYFKSLENKE